MSGRQCHLRLWYETREPRRAVPPDEVQQAVFATGHEVGEAARLRYPGGRLIAHDHLHSREALEETRRAIDAGGAPALFEAAFVHDGVLVRTDVLERLSGGGWRLVEVKASTRLKDIFVYDLAVQFWVLRGAGLDVRDAGVLTLDRSYVYDGFQLDRNALFRMHPLSARVGALGDAVGRQVRRMQAMLAAGRAPDIAPGAHCFSPYACPFHAHCTRDSTPPDHGIDELPGLQPRYRDTLAAAGISELRDIPETFPLSPLQRAVRQAVRTGGAVIRQGMARPLRRMAGPIRHLDFETCAPAIPRFAGTRPYDAVPFLFSVHTETGDGPPAHVDYLHEGDDDPRPHIAERLIRALGREGTICTYSGYERQILRSLAAALPVHAGALAAIEARLSDLLVILRNGYYHPAFRGSFSIKAVLPVLAPGQGYGGLAIADGRVAALRYQQALASGDPEVRRRIFDDLRAYCAQDTLAMVALRRALLAVDDSSGTPC